MRQPGPKIRMLHLISTLDVGGAEQNLLRLASSMDAGLFENHVACMTRPGPLARSLELAGIPVHSLNMRKGVPDPRAVLRLRFTASLVRPDLVQCWMYHANLLGLALLNPKRTLWNIRCSDMDLSLYGGVYRFAVKTGALLSGLPSAVVVNSKAGRDVHEALGYRPRQWAVIPNGFDTAVFRPDPEARVRIRAELGIPGDAFTVGLVCRYDPMKDHEAFFLAAEKLLRSCPDARFILAGRGVTRDNPSLRKILPDSPAFHLLGERSDIPAVCASLDVATSSSAWGEGLPNAVGEAMASGIPCAVTDAGDSAALVGETGVVVPKADPSALCSAWESLHDAGVDRRRALGEKARKRILEHYGLSAMVERYQSLYQSLTEDPGS